MKTALSFLTTLILIVGGSANALAQPPYEIVNPGPMERIEFSEFVGGSQTIPVTLVRYTPEVTELTVTTLEDEFTTDVGTFQFTDNDTAVVWVTFTPTGAGIVTDSLMFVSNIGYITGNTLYGAGFDPAARYSIDKDTLDYGILSENFSQNLFLIVTNHSNEEITLQLSGTGSTYTTIWKQQQTQTVSVAPNGQEVITVRALSTSMPEGRNEATLRISDGSDIDGTGKVAYDVHLTAYRYVGDGPLIEAIPQVLDFERDPVTGALPSATLVVRNLSSLDVVVTSFEVIGNYEVLFPTDLPKLLGGGMDMDIEIQATAPGTPPIDITEIVVNGRWLAGGMVGELTNAGLRYIDTLDTDNEIRVRMTSSEASVGETTTMSLIAASDLPNYVSSGRATLSYNATVLVPKSEMEADTIIDGTRHSTFSFSAFGHTQGSVVSTMDFIVALGNATSSEVAITDISWFNADGSDLAIETIVDAGVVSVENADGFTTNADPGPLKLSASPLPASDNLSISYERGQTRAALRLYDASGTVVADYSYVMADDLSGNAQLNLSSMPRGVYFLHLTSNSHSVVRIIPIE